MMGPAPLSPVVASACEEFLAGLRKSVGDQLVAVYVHGSAVFPESHALIRDVDFHVIVRRVLADEDRQRINELHRTLAQDHSPIDFDGFYLTLDDAVNSAVPPNQCGQVPFDKSWALHRSHIHADKFALLFGVDPRNIVPEATWVELEQALAAELRFVMQMLNEHPEFCVLNLCRILYSALTRNVVLSKPWAGAWALRELPIVWHPLIEAAQRCYSGQGSSEDQSLLAGQIRSFLAFVIPQLPEVVRG